MKWFGRKPKSSPGPVCRCCGKPLSEMPTDYGWMLPDVVWAEGQEARRQHLEWSTDLCFSKGLWYLRGVLEMPFRFQEGRFGWGAWAEVSEETMERFRAVFEVDGSHCPREQGVLACEIPLSEGSLGLPIEVQFGRSELRPLLYFVAGSSHPLARLQREGLTVDEYQTILDIILH